MSLLQQVLVHVHLPGLEVDGTYVMTSDEALEMEELPKSIINCWWRCNWN